LKRCVHKRFYEAGETIFIAGTPGDALMLIAHGSVRIDLQLDDARRMHMAAFGRGQFFGRRASSKTKWRPVTRKRLAKKVTSASSS